MLIIEENKYTLGKVNKSGLKYASFESKYASLMSEKIIKSKNATIVEEVKEDDNTYRYYMMVYEESTIIFLYLNGGLVKVYKFGNAEFRSVINSLSRVSILGSQGNCADSKSVYILVNGKSFSNIEELSREVVGNRGHSSGNVLITNDDTCAVFVHLNYCNDFIFEVAYFNNNNDIQQIILSESIITKLRITIGGK